MRLIVFPILLVLPSLIPLCTCVMFVVLKMG